MSQLWERQPIAASAISVVVLLDNFDTAALQKMLTELHPVLSSLNRPCEVLFTVSASVETLLHPALSACPHSRLVHSETASKGQGAALQAGIDAAVHPLLFVLPAGYSAQVLPAFLKQIDLVDVVCGVRANQVPGWKRRQFFSATYQLFGLWVQDPDCPQRLYRREIFRNIPIQSLGSFAHAEILAKGNFQSRLMTEEVIEGPATNAPSHRSDFWKVLQNPQFGKPPEKIVEAAPKPMFTTQAPEARI